MNEHLKWKMTEEEIINISFLVFYYGVEKSTATLLNNILPTKKQHIIDKLIEALQFNIIQWNAWMEYKNKEHALLALGKVPQDHIPSSQKKSAIYIQDDNEQNFYLTLRYKPFNGHLTRLGHYYRHLYQMIKLIDEFDNNYLGNKNLHIDKNSYASIIRAQLSSNEQLLLFYNSLSYIGEGWLRNNYLKNYKLLKNIPLPLANFGKTPIDVFGRLDDKGEKLFQWDMED